ncbi:UNVERIFIED_CONTAM: putative mitochondrial protein [Sesamum radiatum]|uniref:Mitochondrial protein n=1 Tax=Sesamum radiatum TaxID=300843 RepID=A0AAW2JWC4_SESRA
MQSAHDYCLFIKTMDSGLLALLVYVDDILLIGPSLEKFRLSNAIYVIYSPLKILGCPSKGLFLPALNSFTLKAYSDVDWTSCPDSRRSLTGFTYFLEPLLFLGKQRSKLQSLVPLLKPSIAAWLSSFVRFVGFPFSFVILEFPCRFQLCSIVIIRLPCTLPQIQFSTTVSNILRLIVMLEMLIRRVSFLCPQFRAARECFHEGASSARFFFLNFQAGSGVACPQSRLWGTNEIGSAGAAMIELKDEVAAHRTEDVAPEND